MTSLIVKVILIPIVLFIGMYSSVQIEFGALWQPFAVAFALIAAGVGMEYLILSKETFWSSIVMDFITSLLIIWGLSNILPEAAVTFIGAFTLSIVLGVNEYFLHHYLVGPHEEKRRKTPV